MINRGRSRLKLLMRVMITGYYMRLIRLPRQNYPERRKRGRRMSPRAIAPNRCVTLTLTTTKHTPIGTGYKCTRRPGKRGRRGSRGRCYSSCRRRRPITHTGSWRCGVEPRRWGEKEAVMVVNIVVASTDIRLELSLIERCGRGGISSGVSLCLLLAMMRRRSSPIIIHTRMT